MCDLPGVGIDLCEISRMEDEKRRSLLLRKCYTEQEAAYIASKGKTQAQTMAGLWAAKEAVLKALGTGIAIPMRDVEILHGEMGEPLAHLTGQAAQRAGGQVCRVSITHEGGYAAAICVLTPPQSPAAADPL